MNGRRQSAEVISLLLVCFVSSLAFRSTYVSWRFVPFVAIAAIGPALVSLLARHSGWSLGWSTLASLLSYVAVATVLLYWVPSPGSSIDAARDSVEGWRVLLTLAAPVDPTGPRLVVPLCATWIGTAAAVEAAVRGRSALAPTVGPLLILCVAGLFGRPENASAFLVGTVLAPTLLIFLFLRSEDAWLWRIRGDQRNYLRHLGASVILVGSVLLVGAVVASLLTGVSTPDRVSLRDLIEPPFDVQALRTPLVEFKSSLRDDAEDDVTMVVSGSNLAGRRVRIATLDEYDGVVWAAASVADGQLVPVSPRFPGLVESWSGAADRFDFELRSHSGHWLPTIGAAQAINWGGSTEMFLGDDPQALLRIDPVAGNMLVSRLLGPLVDGSGLTYSIEAIDQPVPAGLTSDEIMDIEPRLSTDLYSPFSALASEIVGQERSGYNKLLRLEAALSEYRPDAGGSAISSAGRGKNPTYDLSAPPGHALYRVAQLLNGDEDEFRGTTEQYATTLALLISSVGIPSRVVVGYEIRPEMVEQFPTGRDVATVRRSDLTAWVEVPFVLAGWVPFRAGPPESAVPEGKPSSGGGVARLPPPPPPVAPDRSLPVQAASDGAVEVEACDGPECVASPPIGGSIPAFVVFAAVGSLTPLLFVGVAVGGIVYMKNRRRRRRRAGQPASSVAGAWREFIDNELDAGLVVPDGTIRQAVVSLADHPDAAEITQLSEIVESAAYSPIVPTIETATTAWERVEQLERARGSRESKRRTALRRFNPKSLTGSSR